MYGAKPIESSFLRDLKVQKAISEMETKPRPGSIIIVRAFSNNPQKFIITKEDLKNV